MAVWPTGTGLLPLCCVGRCEAFFFRQGKLCQVFFIFAQKDPRTDQPDNGDDTYAHACWARDFGYFPPQQVGAHGVSACPACAAQRIKQHEALPVHVACTCQQGHKNAQDRNKAPQKNNGATMVAEQVLAQNKPVGGQADLVPMLLQERQAKMPSDQVANIIPDDRPGNGGQSNPLNGQMMGL